MYAHSALTFILQTTTSNVDSERLITNQTTPPSFYNALSSPIPLQLSYYEAAYALFTATAEGTHPSTPHLFLPVAPSSPLAGSSQTSLKFLPYSLVDLSQIFIPRSLDSSAWRTAPITPTKKGAKAAECLSSMMISVSEPSEPKRSIEKRPIPPLESPVRPAKRVKQTSVDVPKAKSSVQGDPLSYFSSAVIQVSYEGHDSFNATMKNLEFHLGQPFELTVWLDRRSITRDIGKLAVALLPHLKSCTRLRLEIHNSDFLVLFFKHIKRIKPLLLRILELCKDPSVTVADKVLGDTAWLKSLVLKRLWLQGLSLSIFETPPNAMHVFIQTPLSRIACHQLVRFLRPISEINLALSPQDNQHILQLLFVEDYSKKKPVRTMQRSLKMKFKNEESLIDFIQSRVSDFCSAETSAYTDTYEFSELFNAKSIQTLQNLGFHLKYRASDEV